MSVCQLVIAVVAISSAHAPLPQVRACDLLTALQGLQRIAQRMLSDLRDIQSSLKQSNEPFVPQIVECQLSDSEHHASARESDADASGLVREDELVMPRLPIDDIPRLAGHSESLVWRVGFVRSRRVAYQAALTVRIIVLPFKSTYLGYSASGV